MNDSIHKKGKTIYRIANTAGPERKTAVLTSGVFTAIVQEGNPSDVRADLEELLEAVEAAVLDVHRKDLVFSFCYSRHGYDFEAILPRKARLRCWIYGMGSKKSFEGYRVFEVNFELEVGGYVEATNRMNEVSRTRKARPSKVA